MTARVLPFTPQPEGFEWLEDEPEFDAGRHLDLTFPTHTLTLEDFGYDPAEVASTATRIAATSAFRILSDEGARIMLEVARRLEARAESNPRIQRMVRSGCHRSRWLRDLCTAPELTEHLCSIYGVDVAPHPIVSQLGHLNYAPTEVGTAVDKWHHDTLPLDFVMMVADPLLLDGGDFEYFVGTKHEMDVFAATGDRPPAERCVSVEWPGPGYAVALHGNMVVHRGGPLHQAGERISMVNGYVSTDVGIDDQERNRDLFHVDEPVTLSQEWARYAAWRARERLGVLLQEIGDAADPSEAAQRLHDAVADVTAAIAGLEANEPSELAHYER